jgi:type IV secretion system protein VirB4
MFESYFVLTITYLPPKLATQKFIEIMYTDSDTEKRHRADEILAKFKNDLNALISRLSLGIPTLKRLHAYTVYDDAERPETYDDELAFINFCITGSLSAVRIPANPFFLDSVLGGHDFYSGVIPKIGDKFIQCVAIDGFPLQSYAGILNSLACLSCSCRWNTRFIFLDQHVALAEIKKHRRKWKQKERGLLAQLFNLPTSTINQDAVAMTEDADAFSAEISSDLAGAGYYTSVIVLMHHDRKTLQNEALEVAKAIGRLGFSARIESVNNIEAYLGSLPSNGTCNIRRPLINTLNFAHAIPSSSPWAGDPAAPCPFYPKDSPVLMHCVTSGGTPFRLNLHYGDLGHTFILGPTGSGKSTLLATLAAQFRRYPEITIYCFDKGMSMYALCEAVGGSHYEIAADDSELRFCPLQYLATPAERSWAAEWVSSIFELNNLQLSPEQHTEISSAVTVMHENGERTLTALYNALQDLTLREALNDYIGNSTGGNILDADEDSLALSSFTVFEMEELMNLNDRFKIPVLLYLFRRIQNALSGQPAIIMLDEAWLMLANPVFREKIREWLKVLRKANCAVIMATQSIQDAQESGILGVINESCPTKIFLPNTTAKDNEQVREMYHSLGLSDTQIGIIANAVPKREYYFVNPHGKRLFSLALEKLALSFVAVSDKKTIRQIKELKAKYNDLWPEKYLLTKGINLESYLNV